MASIHASVDGAVAASASSAGGRARRWNGFAVVDDPLASRRLPQRGCIGNQRLVEHGIGLGRFITTATVGGADRALQRLDLELPGVETVDRRGFEQVDQPERGTIVAGTYP